MASANSATHHMADSHTHIQLDPHAVDHLRQNARAFPIRLAAMSVGDDWDLTAKLAKDFPDRIIPCYGIHPWQSHRYGNQDGDTLRGIVKGWRDGWISDGIDDELPTPLWKEKLRDLLANNPRACIGECGLDRAATIPGLSQIGKVMVKVEHQIALVKYHLELSCKYQRPISLHCVQSTGHMESLLRTFSNKIPPPPAVMLHSFGGSAESIRSFTSIPNIGSRIYFSFSSTINVKKDDDGKQRQKVIEKIQAVADDRLLIESDQDRAEDIAEVLIRTLDLISEAKGWTNVYAARQCFSNFQEFYKDCDKDC